MKNIINLMFFVLLSILMLVTFWGNISDHTVKQRLSVGAYATPTLNHPVTNEKILLPLGTDEYRRDYAVVLSSSFRYNIYLASLGSISFLIVSVCLGLGMGLIQNNSNHSKKNKITYLLKDFCDIITEFFQSVPLLIVLIISVLFFQMYIDNPDIRLSLTILVLSLFSSPKLSIQLEGNIKKLRKEEFILAAKASGISKFSLIFKHILYYESKGILILQTINFFLFSIMIEIFLTFFGKGAPDQLSLGKLITVYSFNISEIGHLINMHMYQDVVLTLTPFVFIILLCLSIRWLGNRILIITDTK